MTVTIGSFIKMLPKTEDLMELTEEPTSAEPEVESAEVALVVNGNTGEFSSRNDENKTNAFTKVLTAPATLYNKYKSFISKLIKVVVLLLFLVYLGYSLYVEFGDEGSIRLLCFSLFGLGLLSWSKIKHTKLIRVLKRCCKRMKRRKSTRRWRLIFRWFLYIAMVAFFCVYVGMVIIRTSPSNLTSLGGIFVLMALLVITSTNASKIPWHTVFWGFSLQFVLAVIILKTSVGSYVVLWISARFEEFMSYSNVGARYLFGPDYRKIYFAFVVLPQILVFCAFINVLSYLGVLHFININLGKVLAFCVGTSAPEAINAVANMFLGGNETLIIIKEFLDDLTVPQLFCTYVNGMASIAGTVLVTYVGFGVPAQYLIAASVMSAPAALASAKLNMPDEEPFDPSMNKKTNKLHNYSQDKNIIHALTNGGVIALSLIGNIAVNLIVFFAMLEFAGKTVEWFGERAGVENLSLERIAAYIMWPFAFVMGISREDCLRVGGILGIKTLIAPGPAYILLGQLFNNKRQYRDYSSQYNDTVFMENGDLVLPQWNVTLDGILTDRSEVIGTYAMCGFACLTAMGTMLGAYSALTPKHTVPITRLSFRAVIVGTFASYFTACFAGLLMEE